MARVREKKGWEPATGFAELREASEVAERTVVTHTGCSTL